MQLLFLNHNVAGRGTFGRAFGFGAELAQRGHDVTLITTSPDRRSGHTEFSRRGVHIVEAPDLMRGRARTGWDPWNTLWRLAFLRKRRFDLVHAFDSRPVVVFPALATRRRLGCKIVMDWCDWWGRGGAITEREGWFLRVGFAPIEVFFEESFRTRMDGATVISQALADRAAALGVPRDRILHVVNGANVEEIEPLTLAEARRRLGSMAPDVPVVGSLGQMYSDFSFLFETFAHIRAELPDCKLLLLGDLPRDISLDGIPPDSLWRPGYVPREELPLYLGACNLFLLPRRDILANRGRWPGKVGDYLAAARPVVTTAVGEIETIFRDTEGVVLTQVNAQAVAQEALALLLDRERAEELGKAAYRAAGEKLSWVEFTDRLEAFYDRILRGS